MVLFYGSWYVLCAQTDGVDLWGDLISNSSGTQINWDNGSTDGGLNSYVGNNGGWTRAGVYGHNSPNGPPSSQSSTSDSIYPAANLGFNLPIRLETVTSTMDSGPGTLRQVLADVPNGNTIDATGISGTIVLTNGQLNISNSVNILGPGAGFLTVSGNNASRVFNVTGTNVTISGLTIANGNTSLNGAGIYAGASPGSVVAINNCVVTNNISGWGGGGIFNNEGVTMTVSNCTLTGNSANNGGAIYSTNATLTVITSTLNGNSAGVGGGIMNDGQSDANAFLAIISSTLSSNSASAGGAILNYGPSGSATLTINVSTLSGNSASYSGGGIDNNGWYGNATVTINASTFNGNSAGTLGGGIFNDVFSGTATVEVGDTIFNAGASGANIQNAGTVASDGYNLSSDGSGSSFLTATNDQNNTDPKLGPLQDNGSPTWTCALLPNSPAIDQGDANAVPGMGLATDQRGFKRSVDFAGIPNAAGGDGSDIGAFEVQISLGCNPLPLTGPTKCGNGSFQFSFTNTPGACFTVYTATNVALPFTNWTVLGMPIEIAPGQFQFTDSQATNSPQRYYRVTSP